MKTILIYQTDDGTRFDKKRDAERYETMASCLFDAEKEYLGERTKEVEKASAYLEHNPESVKKFKEAICLRAAEYIPEAEKIFRECATGSRHISHAERVISDYGIAALQRAFFRLRCINEKSGREYQQPYYASHPEEWEKDYEKYFKRPS